MGDPAGSDIEVFVGVDVAKGVHWACACDDGGEVLSRGVPNDEAAIVALIDEAAAHFSSSAALSQSHRLVQNLPPKEPLRRNTAPT